MQPEVPKIQERKGFFPLDNIAEIGLDKIKLNLPAAAVDHDRITFIEQRVPELEERHARPRSAKGKAYRKRLSVPVSGEHVLIEWVPNRAGYPYAFSTEFNPNHYLRKGGKAVAELAGFFRFLFGHDAQQLLSHALISRLDVNVDFNINVLDGTLVCAKGKRGGANVMCNFDGTRSLGSLYVGVLGSDRRLAIYDKAAETLSRELKPQAGKILAALASPSEWNLTVRKLREKTSGPAVWRMEVHCLPKPARPVSEFAEFASCFEGISLLYLPPERAPFNSSLGRAFIGLARHDGIPAALQTLDEPDRRRMNRAIAKLEQVEWFNAAVLREYIGTALDRFAPLFRPPERVLPGVHVPHRVTTRSLPVREIVKEAAPEEDAGRGRCMRF